MECFYKLPQFLFSERCGGISNDAKLLYCFMLDRMKLSEMNGWYDGGRCYIIFSRKEACGMLGIAKDKAAKLYAELEKVGLIEQKKQYLSRPTLIFVNDICAEERKSSASEDGNADIKPSENKPSECRENRSSEVEISAPIKTYYNQNKNNHINNNHINHSDTSDGTGKDNSAALTASLNEKLEIDLLKRRYPLSEGSIEEMRDIIAEVMLRRRKVTFDGKTVPEDAAAERFGKLTSDNICLVLDALSQTSSDIRRIDAYIATSLYGSTFMVSSRNEVGWRGGI